MQTTPDFVNLELCVPPPPVPGCYGGNKCLVCHPRPGVGTPDYEWAQTKDAWAKQQVSPFVAYKLVKRDPQSATGIADLTSEDLSEVEARAPAMAAEWQQRDASVTWVRTALEVVKKLKNKDAKIREFLCAPVPAAVSDYHHIILHPQDLGSIEARLRSGGFAHPDEWIAAVRTVFYNAFVYNRPVGIGVAVLAAANAGSKLFEEELLRLRGIVRLVAD